MTESKYQAKLIKEYEADGWYVIKLITTNKNGICDLLLLKSSFKTASDVKLYEVKFVEVKAEKGKLSPLQEYRIKELKEKNFNVEVKYFNKIVD